MNQSFRPIVKYIYHNSALARYYWLRLEYAKRRRAMNISDVEFAKIQYREIIKGELNLETPVTFNDKLWYLKLSNRDPLLEKCSDKYLVREYVKECGLGHILNELYGVYDNAKDIDFNKLPSPCFLKCNHTSGSNIIYDRSKPFNKRDFVREFNFMLKQNYYVNSREWNYKNIKTRIICERVLKDEKTGELPMDYKFFCFGGVPKLLVVSIGLCQEDGRHARGEHNTNFYDMDYNPLDIEYDLGSPTDGRIACPDNFDKMKEYAAILSKPFRHCRVDLYNLSGKIYFGEITFYSNGGNIELQEEWQITLGDWLDVSGYHIAEDAKSTDPRR